jgi:hypothetical protein
VIESNEAAASLDDEAFHRDDQKLLHPLDLDDGERLFPLSAVGHVNDTSFEQVVAMEFIEHDERMGNIDVSDFESDVMIY